MKKLGEGNWPGVARAGPGASSNCCGVASRSNSPDMAERLSIGTSGVGWPALSTADNSVVR